MSLDPFPEPPAYVVESSVECLERRGDGPTHAVHTGTARVWVNTEERAKEIVQQGLDASPPVQRTYREVPIADVPQVARENLLRARGEALRARRAEEN